MLEKAFQPRNRLFTLSLIGLAILSVCAIVLLGMVVYRLWAEEQTQKEVIEQFRQEYRLWQKADIEQYTVTYTNCNFNFCCQQAQLEVMDELTYRVVPACSSGSARNWHRVYSMNSLYAMIDDWLDGDNARNMTIRYDPDYHYITYLELVPWDGAEKVTLYYEQLTPLEQENTEE